MDLKATPPIPPYQVLGLALLLPGVGHVVQGQPQRGLMFLFFTVLLGWVSLHLTGAEHSVIGRYAGGIFVYGVSVLDAYKLARISATAWARRTTSPLDPAVPPPPLAPP